MINLTPTSAKQRLVTNGEPRPIRIMRAKVLEGCNIYHDTTVICQRIDLGSLAGLRSYVVGPQFFSRFTERFKSLEKMIPAEYVQADFELKLNTSEGASFAEVLFEAMLAVDLAMALKMCRLAPLRFAKIFPTARDGTYDFVWECASPKVSRAAVAVACAGVIELLPARLQPPLPRRAESFRVGLSKLEKLARRRQRSLTAEVLAIAATNSGLPCKVIAGSYLQLGHGVLQRVIRDSFNGGSQAADGQDWSNAPATGDYFGDFRLPACRRAPASNAEAVGRIANVYGYPVYLSPLRGQQQARMRYCVRTPADIAKAFEQATRDDAGVMVEQFVSGQQHRFLVVGNRFVSALHIVAPSVTGDGASTIMQLIDELNSDPVRNGVRQTKIRITSDLLETINAAGYALQDTPPYGTEVPLYTRPDILSGATFADVTDIVHPDNKRIAIRAAYARNLNIAGIDFVTQDVTRSYSDVGGAITDVNVSPELFPHAWPRYGEPHDVGSEILKLAFPQGCAKNIPIMLVAGSSGTAVIAHQLEQLLRADGRTVALATSKKVAIGGKALEIQISRRRDIANFLLDDPRTESLLFTRSVSALVEKGLGLDRCDVIDLMDPADNEDRETYRQVLELLQRASSGIIVVNSGNRMAVDALSATSAERLVLISRSNRDGVVQRHLDAGHVAVLGMLKQGRGYFVIKRNQTILNTIPVAALINSRNTEISARQLNICMHVIAMAYGAGLRGEALAAAINTQLPLHRMA